MATKKITELPSATSIGPTDLLMVVQNQQNKKIPIADFFSSIPVPLNSDNQLLITGVPEAITSGALDSTVQETHLTLNGTNTASLGAGTEGQTKFIIAISTVNPSSTSIIGNIHHTQIIFNKIGDSAFMKYINGKWAFFGGTATVV